MSIEKIHLRKLLQLFYLPPRACTSHLRADIRDGIKKASGEGGDGGDFYGPFWADAKNHVAGLVDLNTEIAGRIKSNPGRARLYPLLGKGFLRWWDEKRRWRNEPFHVLPEPVKGQLILPQLNGATIKVENMLALQVDGKFHRLVYPYFSEDPILPEEGRRLGIFVLHQALPVYALEDLRILDVLRGSSYGTIDHGLRGDELEVLQRKYRQLLAEWHELQKEYEPA